MENHYCVYKLTSPSGKCYIGYTGIKPEERWKNGHGYHDNDYLKNAFNKYGWENFTKEILYSGLTFEEACELEIKTISKYKSNQREFGYNIQNGGASRDRIGEETKSKISNSLKEYFKKHDNPMLGKTHSDKSNYQNMMSQKTRKEVMQIDLETNEIINIFPSINEASRFLGILLSGISHACNGHSSQAGGYGFQFVDDPHPFVPNTSKLKAVAKLDKDTGEIIEIYQSIAEAQKDTGAHNIGVVCRGYGKHKSSGGYKWKYVDDLVKEGIF